MQTAEFELTVPERERSQTHILDRTVTGIGLLHSFRFRKVCPPQPRGVF